MAEQIAQLMAQSNTALAETLATALRGVRAAPIPSAKLIKFLGAPQRSTHPTIVEWLSDFDRYARQFQLSDVDQAVVLLDHLGGAARDKVDCHPEAVRYSLTQLKALLRLRFGPIESVASLNAAFHARMQSDGESLADYSRALMRLHDRMAKAAASQAEGQALSLLRDNALKEQFARGVRGFIRHELRRIIGRKRGGGGAASVHRLQTTEPQVPERCIPSSTYRGALRGNGWSMSVFIIGSGPWLLSSDNASRLHIQDCLSRPLGTVRVYANAGGAEEQTKHVSAGDGVDLWRSELVRAHPVSG